jgi:hypothetical protein
MPRYEITSPEGKRFEINAPEGATQEQVLAYAQSSFAPKAEAPKGDKLELAGDGGFKGSALGGIVQGGRDVLDAGAQMLSHAVPEGVRNAVNSANNYLADKTGLVGRIPEGGVDQQIAQNEQSYQEARKASGRDGIDAARITGNIASTLPIASVKALQLVPGKGLMDLGNIARAAVQGGIAGSAQPVTSGNFGDEKLKQIGSGAAFGAASAPVGAALGRVISPQTSKEVKTLMDQGVTPTAGQILGGRLQSVEDRLMSVPLLGDAITTGRKRASEELNRAAYARALTGTGVDAKTLPVGREGIAAVKETLGQAYDNLLPKLSFRPDQQFASELSNLRQMASNLAPTEARRFESLLNEHLSKLSPNGSMTGETFKVLESSLGNEAKRFSGSPDAYQKELGGALKEALNVFRSGLVRSNPQMAQELAALNKNYANYAILRNAGSRAGDMSGGFTPSQLAAAVRASDRSAGKGAGATGQALMQDLSDAGVKVLNSKYPDSGTVGRALLAGGLGAGAVANPAILAAGAAALPYTKSGQKIMAALLARRPEFAKVLSAPTQQLAPLVGTALAQSLSK